MANEKRLIDPAEYKSFLKRYINDFYEIDAPMIAGAIERCLQKLELQPTVDAVEVVRCKDCLHQRKYWHKPPECHCLLYDRATREDGFCDRGEPMPANKKRAYQLYGKEKEKESSKLG